MASKIQQVDIDLIKRNLLLSPQKRLEQHQQLLNFITELIKWRQKNHARTQKTVKNSGK